MAPPLQPGQPFFYDFDEYSPSESDTSTSSSDDRRQQDDPAPTRKKLKRRPTDRSLEEAPGLEGGGDDGPVTKRYSRFSIGNQYFKTKGKVSRLDGRLKISVDETANTGWLAKALGSGIKHHLGLKRDEDRARSPEAGRDQQQAADALDAIRRENLGQAGDVKVPERIPKLNVVIIVIGSRGDIQPFLKVGKILQNDHGHRVRIATHPAFKDFVEKDSGLEFFSVGGDPSELMAFMVKNPGLIPSVETVKAGEIGRRRKSILQVPYTYMWSPTLVPKPEDWGPEVNVTGFTFLDLASSFTPPDDLTKFLEAGPPPVYIGFGSIVVDDPDAFTEMIFRAVELAGVRALVSKGWGGIGGEDSAPDNVYLLENTPHDWLFPRVSAVVHHGGAGTTAIGLKCGKPTMIVPFFGDQPFWGAMVSKAKAGAHACVPYKKLTAERLAEGIAQCLSDEARANVTEMAERIEAEGDGAANAVASFHASLPLSGEESMRCAILDDRVATWQLKEKGKWKGSGGVKLSPLAAEILTVQKRVRWSDLRLARTYDWNDFDGPGEPISGVGGAVTGTVVEATQGIGSVPANIMKSVKKHGRHEHKKRKLAKKKQKALDNAAREQPSPPPPAPDLDVEPQEPRESEAVETDDKAATVAGQEGQQQQLQEEEEEEEPQPSDSSQRPNAPTRASTTLSTLTDPGDPLPTEVCRTTGRGLHQSASALARAPVDLALALAQGFHNAPRLYGDDTAWDAKEKEADERKSEGKKKKKKTTKDEGATAGDDEVINNEKLQLAAGQRPVPRRRSTLKKKQRPPKAAGAKKRQHQAPVGEDEEGQQPPAIPRRSASAKTPRTEAEMGKRAGTVFDVDDHPDNGDEQQDRFEGFVFHDGAAATKLPDEVAGKDSMAEELAVAERKPSPGDPALVRSASDTVDFAFGGRNGSGNGNGNGVTAA
ncbi:putative udp- transferase protein [Neofusicoccum parvum UCRNP2]|uniref:Putative udp-transferase protein n=1 Tax=Botryosphaeria parva (strain UCR-NP2) TaxID=1287680 RepID=R1G5T4_BOTPV|nr:putative udp- transferase protein [Neofusicoccum parvum UCRNP2]